jgi:hypothetical protein
LHELDAYVTGELTNDEANALEEAMFESPDDDLAFVDRVARHGAGLAEHGTFDMGVPRAHIDALRARGHSVFVMDVGPPGSGTIHMDRDAEFIVTQLHLGRTDLARVDVEITILDHGVTKTIKDVFVDPSDGVVYGLCERPLAELAFGAGPTHTKIRRTDGNREVVGEWHLVPVATP